MFDTPESNSRGFGFIIIRAAYNFHNETSEYQESKHQILKRQVDQDRTRSIHEGSIKIW